MFNASLILSQGYYLIEPNEQYDTAGGTAANVGGPKLVDRHSCSAVVGKSEKKLEFKIKATRLYIGFFLLCRYRHIFYNYWIVYTFYRYGNGYLDEEVQKLDYNFGGGITGGFGTEANEKDEDDKGTASIKI